MTTLETVCVCLGVICAAQSLTVLVLGCVVPFLWWKMRKMEDRTDMLDEVVQELCKAAGLGAKQ